MCNNFSNKNLKITFFRCDGDQKRFGVWMHNLVVLNSEVHTVCCRYNFSSKWSKNNG